jgi:hypothetical protein
MIKRAALTNSIVFIVLIVSVSIAFGGPIKAQVSVIIDRLPIEKKERMQNFHEVVQAYIETTPWLEEDDRKIDPIYLTVQLFLNDSPSNVEDRYNCEFLISSSDIQYYDRRVRFPYQIGEQLYYEEQAVGPLTGVLNFYVYLIIANEFDKFAENGGDLYFKKAGGAAALGKFVRSEFVVGWTEREELLKRMMREPYISFRKMKDHYFYALYMMEENIAEARSNARIAIEMFENILSHEEKFEATKQFLNAHYLEFIKIFKDDKTNRDVFDKLIKLDSDHEKDYREHMMGS